MERCRDFLGPETAGGDESVLVLTVPVELTTSYLPGTARAPEAILEASRQIELYNSAVGVDLEGAGIATVRTGARDRAGLAAFIEANRGEIAGSFHVFIGGEHSITPWILEAMDYGEIGIVWLDAHADLREEYLGDSQSHACAARNSLRFGPIVEIGVRSFSRAERDFIAAGSGVDVLRSWNEQARRAVEALPRRVYLSLDFDAFDPSVIRALGTPEPGGLGWNDFTGILDHLFRSKEIVGMDAVELCPSPQDAASSFIAAKAVYEAVSRHMAGKGSR